MVILGIDPGIATVGFGIIEAEGARLRHIRHGVITTPPGKLAPRLAQIYNDMNDLLNAFKPDEIAVEELFFNTNITTGISVAHGRGVAILAGAQRGIPTFEYTPLQVKSAVVGYGRAEKRQVMLMVERLLKLEAMPKVDDAADALAIAITHARNAASLLRGIKGATETV